MPGWGLKFRPIVCCSATAVILRFPLGSQSRREAALGGMQHGDKAFRAVRPMEKPNPQCGVAIRRQNEQKTAAEYASDPVLSQSRLGWRGGFMRGLVISNLALP